MPPSSTETPYQWLLRHAGQKPAELVVTTWPDSQAPEQVDWAGLAARVEHLRGGLSAHGIRAGDRVLLVLPNGIDFATAFLACVGSGAIPVPAPGPAAGRAEAARERIRGIIASCQPAMIMTSDDWTALIRGATADLADSGRLVGVTGLRAAGSAPTGGGITGATAGDIAFLQYTSGSTGKPRGVIVTFGSLLAQCRQAAEVYQESPADVAVTWVPLYHDMGLITGLLRPLFTGYPTVLLRPEEFVRSPVRWLTAIGHFRATLSSAPNFGYDLCVRKVPAESARRLDLRSWRVARNAGDMVRAHTLRRFTAHFAAAGLRPTALCPSYGLAEATLTVTTSGPEAPPLTLTVDRAALEQGLVVPDRPAAGGRSRTLVSSGLPLPGTRIRIGSGNPDGRVGEVLVQGPQLSPGYWAADIVQPAQPVQASGWCRTRDLGFQWEGHLFILGRADDTLVVNGRKYFSGDIADACAAIAGIRPGRVAAFDETGDCSGDCSGDARIRLVAELSGGTDQAPDALASLAREIQRTVARRVDLFIAAVGLVGPGELPITTSGKVRVSEVRRRCAEGRLAVRAQVPPRPTGHLPSAR
jgi:acyl-CoA synthetase (AMP-forming)/AMP-acid ligase II